MSRTQLGLPSSWSIILGWMNNYTFGIPITNPEPVKKTRFDNIDFTQKQDPEFWKTFPFCELPDRPRTAVDVHGLNREIKLVKNFLTCHEVRDAEVAIRNLFYGAPALQKESMKGCLLRNASSVTKHGPVFTVTLEKWLLEKYAAGPFMTLPSADFRSNSLMAIEQKDKVRPVLNMSYPKEGSFNSNIDRDMLRKVRMSSAKKFGQSLLRVGRGAIMSKMDMRDAYKMVPARTQDLRLQGFQWMGAYFYETQQIFGATTAVANFDIMAATVQNVSMAQCDIPKHMIHRTLDDVACVAPPTTNWCQQFTATYKRVCSNANIKLAADCPNCEKAFSNQKRGYVLGIQFDSNTLSWRIPDRKAADILSDLHTIIHGGHVDLKQVEVAAGRLNNFGQMCPFLQAFKRPLNSLLASFKDDYSTLMPVEQDLIDDLKVWAAVVVHADGWMPIPLEVDMPPLGALEFVSDAAGGTGTEDWVGVASLGIGENDDFWYLCSGTWPPAILDSEDEKGAKFASKTTTLEMVGLLLPFLTVPHMVRGRHIVLGVDNTSVVFGWENKSSSGDLSASVLIRALHIVATYLECHIYAKHVPRQSSKASVVADGLTRASTAKKEIWDMVGEATQYPAPKVLWDWLENPQVDWQLGLTMIDHINNIL